MVKLKTLNDIEGIDYHNETSVDREKLKAEAIKWVKEDLERLKLRNDFGNFIWERPIDFISEWMKRLNITEDDLK